MSSSNHLDSETKRSESWYHSPNLEVWGEEMLLIFARYPEPGKVKTRLVPALGRSGAAKVYREMIEQVVKTVRSLRRDSLLPVVCVEPAERVPEMVNWLGLDLIFVGQSWGDLGDRLNHAFAWAFAQGARRVAAIGTDCIELTSDLIGEAFDRLQERDAVLGPASDGGYYLIALKQPEPEAFRDIPWSSRQTLEVTESRLTRAGASLHQLPLLRDIDTWDDLQASGLGPRYPADALKSA
jgi:rSAM/selenodomain-associated transferase 1